MQRTAYSVLRGGAPLLSAPPPELEPESVRPPHVARDRCQRQGSVSASAALRGHWQWAAG